MRHLNSSHPGGAEAFQLEPTGVRALYITVVSELSGEFTFDLWSVPLDGSVPAVRINTDAAGPAVRTFSGAYCTLASTPDGGSVVFTSAGRLVIAPIDGSRPPVVLVDDPGRFACPLSGVEFTADSRTFIYASQGLFAVSLAGGREPRRLDSSILGSGLRNPDSFTVLGQRRGVLFLADPLEEGAYELFLGVLDRAVRGVPR